MTDLTPARAAEMAAVEGRKVFDIGASYSIATKGSGSTFRIWCPDGSAMIILPESYHPAFEAMGEALAAERAKQEAEIERLREALRFYASEHENPNAGPWGVSSTDFGTVARTALEARP